MFIVKVKSAHPARPTPALMDAMHKLLRDKEEALASAKEFMQLHKDLMPGWEGTCELRAFAGP